MIKKRVGFSLGVLIPALLIVLASSQSVWFPQDVTDRARVYTRSIEFDYFFWTIQSLWEKAGQATLGLEAQLGAFQARAVIGDFLETINNIHVLESQILQIYSNPEILDPAKEAQALLTQKSTQEALFNQQRLLAERILQSQISSTLSKKGLDFINSPFPPVLFKVSSLPDQLILSPRLTIREEASISLNPGLTDDQKDELEGKIARGLDVSALVVPLGGVGVYPTMVYRESSLEYLLKVVAHEWIHNYLTLRPLGWHYDDTPQLRAMNETTADICATEISQAVLQAYYQGSETAPAFTDKDIFAVNYFRGQVQSKFDFSQEMHATRITVDELLAKGKVEEAEQLMENKRKQFWENGYQIRKINQAYFAFYGAYAEQSGGAAGNDPVGPAVHKLREKSANLSDFLNQISVMKSFEQLQKAIIP
jgi:hypothetical protein